MTSATATRKAPPSLAGESRIALAGDRTAPTAAARWEALFGCPAPQRLPSLVEQAVAWREQVLLHGDVSPAIAHDLQLAAEHVLQQRGLAPAGDQPPRVVDVMVTGAAGDERASTSAVAPAVAIYVPAAASPVPLARAASVPVPAAATPRRTRAAPLPPAASQLLPGSQLVKAHGGRNHIVTVEVDGFRYEGELFSSLSAVAKHITGTHWNGLLFFGLRKRRTYPPKPRRHD